jgi:hypothetical protein
MDSDEDFYDLDDAYGDDEDEDDYDNDGEWQLQVEDSARPERPLEFTVSNGERSSTCVVRRGLD